MQNEIDILNKRISSLKEQISGLIKQNKALQEQLVYIKEELKDKKYLAARNLIEKPKVLALQREEASLNGKVGENISTVASLEQKIGETELQIAAVVRNDKKEVLTELRETQQKLAEALEKEKSAEDIFSSY